MGTFKVPAIKSGDQAIELDVAKLGVFNPGSTCFSVAYTDGSVRTWDVETAEELTAFQLRGDGIDWQFAFSPDGRLLLSKSPDRVVNVVDLQTGATVALFQDVNFLWSVCFSPCGQYVASSSPEDPTTVKLWRTSDGTCLKTAWRHRDVVMYMAFSPDGTMLWCGDNNGAVTGHVVDVALEERVS